MRLRARLDLGIPSRLQTCALLRVEREGKGKKARGDCCYYSHTERHCSDSYFSIRKMRIRKRACNAVRTDTRSTSSSHRHQHSALQPVSSLSANLPHHPPPPKAPHPIAHPHALAYLHSVNRNRFLHTIPLPQRPSPARTPLPSRTDLGAPHTMTPTPCKRLSEFALIALKVIFRRAITFIALRLESLRHTHRRRDPSPSPPEIQARQCAFGDFVDVAIQDDLAMDGG